MRWHRYKEEAHSLTGLDVYKLRLVRAYMFPLLDGLTSREVQRLLEGDRGLVHRNAQHAALRRWIASFSQALAANTSHAQTTNLVGAKPGKQPDEHHGTDHGERILILMAAVNGRVTSWQVVLRQVQACPEELCPNVVGDDAWIWADLRTDAARGGKRSERIEPHLAPLPFLAIAEERSKSLELANLGAGH